MMAVRRTRQKELIVSTVAVVGILSLFSQQYDLSSVFEKTATERVTDSPAITTEPDNVPTRFPTKEAATTHPTDSPTKGATISPTNGAVISPTDSPTSQDSMAVASNKNTKLGDKRPTTVLPNAITECLRFATMMPHMTQSTGLGHRFTEVVLGMKFAQEINATYLYNQDIWFPAGQHGGYDWMPEFFPLQETEVTRNNEQQNALHVVQGQWAWMVQNYSEKNSCNIEMRTKLHMCCDWSKETCWCTMDKARIGSFEAMKGRLREAFSKSKYTPSKQLPDLLGDKPNATESSLWIVWHLRVGDIVLNARKEYFSNIATQLAFAFQNSSSTMVPLVVFLGEGGEKGVSKSFPFLPSICRDFFSDNCLYGDFDVRDSLYHMIHSDILVTSGSSLAAMAGLLRSSGITLAARPKEGVVGIYETSEQLLIDKDGTIPKIGVIKEYLEQENFMYL